MQSILTLAIYSQNSMYISHNCILVQMSSALLYLFPYTNTNTSYIMPSGIYNSTNKIISIYIYSNWTYLPRLESMNCRLSACWRFMRPTFVVLTRERLKIACNKQWGATSMITAPLGTCASPSWKRTGDRRLFTWYAADEFCANAVFQADSGIDVLIQRDVRCLGFVMIYKAHNGTPTHYLSTLIDD